MGHHQLRSKQPTQDKVVSEAAKTSSPNRADYSNAVAQNIMSGGQTLFNMFAPNLFHPELPLAPQSDIPTPLNNPR
jgi:hypothetical protein